MSKLLPRPSKVVKRLLGTMVLIDPESLPSGTPGDHRFHYIDIASAANGRLSISSAPIEYRDAPSRARRVVKSGDVLMSTVRPNLKAFAYCDLPEGDFVASTGFAVLRAINGTDSRFVLYSILSDYVAQQIERYTVGSNYPAINSSDIRRLEVTDFAPPVQNRIAEILSTLDETIAQTEALIAKHQQIKAGLMHDLFTRGVTLDGHLRPTREQAPDLYKESSLGWIPKEWDCLTIEQLLAKTTCPMRSGPFGSALLKDELVEEGIPFLGIDNIFVEHFEPTFRRFVSKWKFHELIRYSVHPRDVIITIMGTVGRSCVVPESITEALSSKHLWTMTFDAERVFPELVCWQLNHARWVKNWFARQSQGAVMEAIQSSTLRTLKLPAPPIDEQQQIRDRYLICSRRIATEEECLAKLRQQKHGLMYDLLTGRVCVQVANSAAGVAS